MITGSLAQVGHLCFMDMGIFYACTGKKSLINGPSLCIFLVFIEQQFWSQLKQCIFYCDFSFNAISREFLLAATAGLFLWMGCLSISQQCYFCCSKLDYSVWHGKEKISDLILLITGMALWRDTVVHGYSSPLTSLKELVFGS
jgi:hypothetical protein